MCEGEGERVCGRVREFESARVRDENSRVRERGRESAWERTRIRECHGERSRQRLREREFEITRTRERECEGEDENTRVRERGREFERANTRIRQGDSRSPQFTVASTFGKAINIKQFFKKPVAKRLE